MAPVSNPHPNATLDDRDALRLVCQEVRDCLDRSKRLLDEEIRAYPTPIPRCDAQFNFLYEQRTRLAQMLVLANAAVEETAGLRELANFARHFVKSAPCAERREESELRSRLRATLSRQESAVRFALPPE